VSCVHGIQKSTGLSTSNLPQNDAVRTMAKSRLEKLVKRHLLLVGVGLGFGRDHVRLGDSDLGSILNHQDALVVGNFRR
jgi:hypothetical protein